VQHRGLPCRLCQACLHSTSLPHSAAIATSSKSASEPIAAAGSLPHTTTISTATISTTIAATRGGTFGAYSQYSESGCVACCLYITQWRIMHSFFTAEDRSWCCCRGILCSPGGGWGGLQIPISCTKT
jgi:hypothetical protein